MVYVISYLLSLVFLKKEFDHGVTQIISSIVDHIRQCFVKAVPWTQTGRVYSAKIIFSKF